MEFNKIKNFWLRVFLVVLFLFPLIYFNEFYIHFKVYLTGTVLNGLITREWKIVFLSIILFAVFLIPLTYRKRAKWVDYGLVGAFFVSLFIEMYGIPLTILFASKYFFVPGTVLPENIIEFSFLGVGIGMDLPMVYGAILMLIGMALIIIGWATLYNNIKKGSKFVSAGMYRYSRHPQYLGFVLIVVGWFYGWPTILTLIFSPILIYKYVRAAMSEEKEIGSSISGYQEYRRQTPFFI